MSEYCCEKFRAAVARRCEGEFRLWDNPGVWAIGGCCGQCNVVDDMIFCPFCGSSLAMEKAD